MKSWNLKRDGNISLSGEWDFYWKEVLVLEEIERRKTCNSKESSCIPNHLIKVPDRWNGFSHKTISPKGIETSETLESEGFATYHLRLESPERGVVSLNIPFIGNEYNFYINDVLLHSSGNFSINPHEKKPVRKSYLIHFLKDRDYLDIVVHISNYDYARGGIFDSIEFGLAENMSRDHTETVAGAFSIFGIFLIMGLYHLGLSTIRRDPSSIYFGIICTFISIYHILSDESLNLGYSIIPFIDYTIGIKLEYLFVYLILLLFYFFISEIFPAKGSSKLRVIFSSLILFCCIFTVSTNVITLSLFFNYSFYIILSILISIVYISYNAIKNKFIGSNIFLFGFLILFLLIINDILHRMNIIHTRYLSAYGIVMMIFLQSYILSVRFSRAFIEIEQLSDYLKISNKELELTKERATKAYLDLEASQKQLVQSDKMITLGTMVAGVAHEINTPLGAIKANAENIQESLRNLLTKLNPTLSNLKEDDLKNIFLVLEMSKDSTGALSSKEARAQKKKILEVISARNMKNVEIIADLILDLSLKEALEKDLPIFSHPEIETYLSIASELQGIRKKSSVIQISSERVSKIVKSLKSFMHFDEKDEKVFSDITEGMETVLIILHNKIKYGIEVTKNYETIPQIFCYPDELNQVWTNLIHNAIQAMGDKGNLQIDIAKIPPPTVVPDIDKRNPEYKGDFVSVSITDSGPGILPEIRNKIFQAFFTTKPAGEGSGLGLHIIGKILEKHSGALFLDSVPGRTKFTIVLPIIT